MKRDKLLLNGKYSISVKTNGERTYKALCNVGGLMFAIKVYRLSDVSKSIVDFDQKEIDTAARSLLQPNLVKYIEAFTDRDHFYVVIEYVPNSLDQIILHQRSTEHLAALYVTQIVKGLIFIHYNGYTHKRITPEHILINNDGFVKISDFVLQNTYFSDGDKDVRDMAPEEILLLGRTTAIDIWNIGLILFNCISREHLFNNMTDQEIIRLFQSNNSQTLINELITNRLTECSLTISKECRAFISSCLIIDYTRRPSAQNLLQAAFLKQTNTEIVCGKTGATTLNQNQIDEIQALNDVSAGITTLTSQIPDKGQAATNIQPMSGISITKSMTQLANLPSPTSPHPNMSRVQEAEGDSKTISSGFNKQDQEILRRAILNIPASMDDNRNSQAISAGDATARSPDKPINAFTCVPATANFPMTDDAPPHKQKQRAKSIETGAKQGKKLKNRIENKVENVDNLLDDSSFDLLDVKIVGKLEVKKYEDSYGSDNFSEIIENYHYAEKGNNLGCSTADHLQSKPRLLQTNSAVSSSNISSQKKNVTRQQRATSKPGKNCVFSTGDDLAFDFITLDKHPEKLHAKPRKTRAMSTMTTKVTAKQSTYSRNPGAMTLAPTNGARQDLNTDTLVTGWTRRELHNKFKKNVPEPALQTNLKDVMISANKMALKRTTCPLPMDALNDHWNFNSYSSDDNLPKISPQSNRTSSVQYTNYHYKGTNSNNSESEISYTNVINRNFSKYKSTLDDEYSKEQLDKLLSSLSVENNTQEPENQDILIDRHQNPFKKDSVTQVYDAKETLHTILASPKSPQKKQAYVENDIDEAYHFSVESIDGAQPLVLRLGNTPTARSKLCTVTDINTKLSKHDTCQGDDISISFDTIALPQDQDIASLIHKRQLMLQQAGPNVDDTSSAFSSGASTMNFEKKTGVVDSYKDTPKSPPASPSRLTHYSKDYMTGDINNNDITAETVPMDHQNHAGCQCTTNTSNPYSNLLAKKSREDFYEDKSTLEKLQEKITDTSSTYDDDDYDDDYRSIKNNHTAQLIIPSDKTDVEKLREILINYKINNKISPLSVEAVKSLICASKRCQIYVRDNFSVNFWFVRLKNLVDTKKEEAILIFIIISTISWYDFPFCRDIFLMGLIKLINRLYSLYEICHSFLDKWLLLLLVKLVSEYEDGCALLPHCGNTRSDMLSKQLQLTDKQQMRDPQTPDFKHKKIEGGDKTTKGNSYAVMRIFESIVATNAMSRILQFLFIPAQTERRNINTYVPNSSTGDFFSSIMQKISDPPYTVSKPHEVTYSILLILFQSKTIFKSEILCEIANPSSPLLGTLMHNVDKSILYIFLLQDILFIDTVRESVLNDLPKLFRKLQRMMNAYELMYTAAIHNEDDYDLSASLHIDFPTFSAGIHAHSTNVANIPAIGSITTLEPKSLRYNLTVLLTSIINLLISLSKLVAEPYFQDPFKESIKIFVQILNKIEEYGNAVPYALSSIHSLLRLHQDDIAKFPQIKDIIISIGKIISNKQGLNIYSIQFAIPSALTITKMFDLNTQTEKELKYILLKELRDTFLNVFLNLIETSSVWRRQCLDVLAHILSYTSEFETTFCCKFKLSLTSADYKETLPSILGILISLSKNSNTICLYLANHKELAAGIAYILRYDSKDNANPKINALKLCLELSLNCKDCFVKTYKTVLSILPQFRDMNTDQFIIGASISKQILDTLTLDNGN